MAFIVMSVSKTGDTDCAHAQEIPASEPLTVLLIRLYYSYLTFCIDLLMHDSLLNFIVLPRFTSCLIYILTSFIRPDIQPIKSADAARKWYSTPQPVLLDRAIVRLIPSPPAP